MSSRALAQMAVSTPAPHLISDLRVEFLSRIFRRGSDRCSILKVIEESIREGIIGLARSSRIHTVGLVQRLVGEQRPDNPHVFRGQGDDGFAYGALNRL
jgi:hypothetical protein